MFPPNKFLFGIDYVCTNIYMYIYIFIQKTLYRNFNFILQKFKGIYA